MMHAARRFGRYTVTHVLDGIFSAPADVPIHAAGDGARRHLIEIAVGGASASMSIVLCYNGRTGFPSSTPALPTRLDRHSARPVRRYRRSASGPSRSTACYSRISMAITHSACSTAQRPGCHVPNCWSRKRTSPSSRTRRSAWRSRKITRPVRYRRQPGPRLCGPAAVHHAWRGTGTARHRGAAAARAHTRPYRLSRAGRRGQPVDLGRYTAPSGRADGRS